MSISDLLYQAIPSARNLFMYRHALTMFRYMIPMVNAHLLTHDHAIRWTEYLAYMWLETMQNGRQLQQRTSTLAHASFEALQANPHAVTETLFTECGIPLPTADALAHVLAKDSQSGTAGARDKAAPARQLTDTELAEIAAIIEQIDPSLTPDSILQF